MAANTCMLCSTGHESTTGPFPWVATNNQLPKSHTFRTGIFRVPPMNTNHHFFTDSIAPSLLFPTCILCIYGLSADSHNLQFLSLFLASHSTHPPPHHTGFKTSSFFTSTRRYPSRLKNNQNSSCPTDTPTRARAPTARSVHPTPIKPSHSVHLRPLLVLFLSRILREIGNGEILTTRPASTGQSLLRSRLRQQCCQLQLLPLFQHVCPLMATVLSIPPPSFIVRSEEEQKKKSEKPGVLIRNDSDGSYYYSNPNGSTYHNNGNGGSTYTAPNGTSYSSGYDSTSTGGSKK